ncbi:MAG: C-GCAxxG-C-C family protein [Promethearchaeota archaeon]
MKNVERRSKEIWDSGLYCAESVLMALAEREGIISELIPKIATGFCSGVARTGGMCGALSGAIMAVNLVYGRTSGKESVERNYTAIKLLIKRFEEQFGSINCSELLGCDIGTKEGQKFYQENDLRSKCRELTGGAARLGAVIIDETKQSTA